MLTMRKGAQHCSFVTLRRSNIAGSEKHGFAHSTRNDQVSPWKTVQTANRPLRIPKTKSFHNAGATSTPVLYDLVQSLSGACSYLQNRNYPRSCRPASPVTSDHVRSYRLLLEPSHPFRNDKNSNQFLNSNPTALGQILQS
jgi:hypothetical protein